MKHQSSFLSFVVIIFITLILFSSCGSQRDITYFQNPYKISDALYKQDHLEYEAKIKPNDNLFITVSAINQESVEAFNTYNLGRGGNLSSTSLDVFGHLVDLRGNVHFPLIGEVHLAGLTKIEAIEILQKKISNFVENPVVNIRIMNYKVHVLGEVSRPGVYAVTDEKITIPQALALAGDLTIYGERKSVQLIRMEDGERVFYQIDLTSPELFLSSNYYLHQDDILYVTPNKTRAGSSTYNQYVPLTISVTSLVITIISLFFRYK